MIDRRRFTFGALLVAAGVPAAAAEPAPALATLEARLEATRSDGVVTVKLALANLGDAPIAVQTRSGSRLAPRMEVHRVGARADERLAEIVAPPSVDELMTRAGPRPVYVRLAAHGSEGSEVEVGTYRFAAPEPVESADVEVAVNVPGGLAVVAAQRVRVRRVDA